MNWDPIADQISLSTGRSFQAQRVQSQGGGCINQAYTLSDGEQHYFVKLNHAFALDMFEAEREGLTALAAPAAIRVPQPICSGIAGNQSFLVLEAVDLTGRCDPAVLGQQLATLHQTTQKQYGWHRDNTIGSTPQHNQPHHDWIDFWRTQRLGYQLDLARKNGLGNSSIDRGERLLEALPIFFINSSLWRVSTSQ